MEIVDTKTLAQLQSMKSKFNIESKMQQLFQEMAQRNGKENIDYDEKTIAALYSQTFDPYSQYATGFYDEELRKKLKIKRGFLAKDWRESVCIQKQTEINDIVHNIRMALSITRLGKVLSKQIMIKKYINGTASLCKQTIMTLIASFGGITNFINGVKRGCDKHYEHEQVELAIVILKHFFAYPNILKKICTTNEIFDAFCQFWIQAANSSRHVFIGRNRGAIFPLLLKNDKYTLELYVLELSCLFLRTSYYWIKPKHNMLHSIEKNKIFTILCKWLNERTSNWNYDRISMLTVLSCKNPDDKYANTCHQTNYVFQCLINAIQHASLRMINGGEVEQFLSMSRTFSDCMVKHNLVSALMETVKSNCCIELPDGNVLEAFPGITSKELNKIRMKWKYKMLQCQSSKCNIRFGETNCKLKKCMGCLTTFYCSRSCQKYDWLKHRFECNNIS